MTQLVDGAKSLMPFLRLLPPPPGQFLSSRIAYEVALLGGTPQHSQCKVAERFG